MAQRWQWEYTKALAINFALACGVYQSMTTHSASRYDDFTEAVTLKAIDFEVTPYSFRKDKRPYVLHVPANAAITVTKIAVGADGQNLTASLNDATDVVARREPLQFYICTPDGQPAVAMATAHEDIGGFREAETAKDKTSAYVGLGCL